MGIELMYFATDVEEIINWANDCKERYGKAPIIFAKLNSAGYNYEGRIKVNEL